MVKHIQTTKRVSWGLKISQWVSVLGLQAFEFEFPSIHIKSQVWLNMIVILLLQGEDESQELTG